METDLIDVLFAGSQPKAYLYPLFPRQPTIHGSGTIYIQ